MPKKLSSNPKALEARERKENAKIAERERKEKEAEDALWKDDDKHVARKQQRKDDKEKKKLDQQEKKLQSKLAYEEEMSSLKSSKPAVCAKLTRAEIVKATEKKASAAKPSNEKLLDEQPLEENVNRLHVEGEVARNIEDAIAVLSLGNEKVDMHPEKRLKAAFQAYEDKHLPILKAENPNLRLSQLKQMLHKDWMKSPENPLNQR